MERLCYSSPLLAAPYGRSPSIYDAYYSPRINPMEEAYRYALRNLEDSFEREMKTLCELSDPYSDDYYRREHDAQSYYHSRRDRLEYDFTRNAKQYYYGYVNSSYRSFNDSWYTIQQFDIPKYTVYPPIYFNSKETTPIMPTETKKWIIISSEGPNDNPKTHTTLADAEKEAQRLARKFPAQEFTIYETKKAYKIAEKPVDVKVFV